MKNLRKMFIWSILLFTVAILVAISVIKHMETLKQAEASSFEEPYVYYYVLERTYPVASTERVQQEYKPEVETRYIEFTDEEIRLLCSIIYLEGRGEGEECQKAIASVIVNRMNAKDMSLEEVIYEKNQFETARRASSCSMSESDYERMKSVVDYISKNGPSIPEYITYFRANYYHTWSSKLVSYCQIDNTYFSYDVDVYNRYIQSEK